MRMSRDAGPGGPLIKGFTPAGFRLDEGVFPALVLTVARADNWTPPPIDALTESDLAMLLDPLPEFILLGTGANLVRPPLALVRALEARRIGVEAMDSRAAARAWGLLRSEGRAIAAALYPLDA